MPEGQGNLGRLREGATPRASCQPHHCSLLWFLIALCAGALVLSLLALVVLLLL